MYFLIVVIIIFILIDSRRTKSYKIYIDKKKNHNIHTVPPSKDPAPKPPGRQH